MSWTYDTTLTASKDKVRFYAGDTDSAAAITVTDEEIGVTDASPRVQTTPYRRGAVEKSHA